MDQPFFASLLLGMPVVESKETKTIGTDGEQIVYNPEYINTLTLGETVFVLAHEVMHCVFQHMYRRGQRNEGRWNIAGDYIVNDMLVNERVGIMPKGALHDSNMVKNGKNTTEGVYDLIPDSENNKEPGDEKGPLDKVTDGGKDPSEIATKEAEMKVKVIQAANAAKMQGKLSAGLARMTKELVKPVADWKYILRRFVTEKAKTDLSYAKPKRRFLAEDIYLPSLNGESLGSIVIAVDCSGSINDHMLNMFSNEIKGIIQDTSPQMVHVVYFDSEVLRQDTFAKDEEFKIEAVGGGGTAFSPIFNYIDEKQLDCVACIVLTDLCCSDFGDAPCYPVLWAATENGNAPFGEITFIK